MNGTYRCIRCRKSGYKTALRRIKMEGGGRERLCEGCFRKAAESGEVSPSDPRIRHDVCSVGAGTAQEGDDE